MGDTFHRNGAVIEVIVRDDSGAKIEKRVYKIEDHYSIYLLYRWLSDKYGFDTTKLESFIKNRDKFNKEDKGFLDF